MLSLRKMLLIPRTVLDLNPKYAINGSNTFQQNKRMIYVNVEFDMITSFDKVYVNFILHKYDQKHREYHPYLFNDTIRVCSLLKNPKKAHLHYLVQKLYVLFAKNSNILVCNYEVSLNYVILLIIFIFNLQPKHYYLKNLTYDTEVFNKFVPIGKYTLGVNWWNDVQPLESVANFTFFIDVVMK